MGKECMLGPWCFFCDKSIFSCQAVLLKCEKWHAAGESPIYWFILKPMDILLYNCLQSTFLLFEQEYFRVYYKHF